jgi:hypothetical protein
MNKNGNVDKHYTSRKWELVLLVVLLATVGTFLPPIFSIWLFDKALVILTGTEWVSIVTLSVGAYFGANVVQKHIQKKQFNIESSGVEGKSDIDENEGEDAEDEDDAHKEA